MISCLSIQYLPWWFLGEFSEDYHTVSVEVLKTRFGSPDHFFNTLNLAKVREYPVDVAALILARYSTGREHKLRTVFCENLDFLGSG